MSSSSIHCQSISSLYSDAGMDDTPSTTLLDMHDEIGRGITSIFSHTKTMTTLRRTLSVDMPSRNWISCEELLTKGHDHFPHIEESSGSMVDVWNSIQEDKRKTLSQDQWKGEFEVWSAITSRDVVRRSESETIPTEYVPSIIRRSSSCLSEKSLEICTERLGSETGSDAFSSSETRGLFRPQESEGEKNEYLFSSAFGRTSGELDFDSRGSFHAPAAVPRNKQRLRSFPPPIPSLSPAADGAFLLMRSRRGNGRLVLEAVSVPSQKNFQTRRENGRLTLEVTTPDVEPHDYSDFISDRSMDGQEKADGEGGGLGDDVGQKEGAAGEGIGWIISKKTESTVETATSSPHIDCIVKLKIPKITIVMNKQDEVSTVLLLDEINEGEVEINSVAINLPQPLRSPSENLLNMYECVWRTKPCTTSASVTDSIATAQPPLTLKSYRNVFPHNDHDSTSIPLEDTRENIAENCCVSVMKDSKSSFFFLPPHCIATS